MTPEQKLKHAMLLWAANNSDISLTDTVTSENVDELYETLLVEQDLHWDAQSEMRGGEVETGIECDYSRHYESKSVAAKMPDGSWVGWTYWYGGGKHGEPEAIDWMEDAYDLTCTEEEKVVVVRTFARATD
jgi:hypothetical protein